jgi:hypothetical protein
MSNAVSPWQPGAAIVAEEERLLGQVQARAALGDEDDGPAGHDRRRRRRPGQSLRDQISEARAEDLPPLIEQMTRLAALRSRLGGSRSLPIDLQSPYFAHIRLRSRGKRRDVMIGKRGFIDRTSNVQIVDWRNAPVSRIYYRYEEGDDYEEEFAGKSLDGVVEARRNVSIHKGALRRIGAPQGTYIKDARGAWQEAVGTMQPVLHGGVGKAARPVVATGGTKGKLGVHHGQADPRRQGAARDRRADRQGSVRADLAPRERHRRHPGRRRLGQDHGRAAPGRLPQLRDGGASAQRMLFVVPSAALVRYVAACCRRWASPACRSRPTPAGRAPRA